MATIVANMSTPEKCCYCRFSTETNPYCVENIGAICLFLGKSVYDVEIGSKSADCPLSSANEMIKEIETDMSWDMYDENGNETDLHKRLMSIIHKYTDK